MNRRNFILASGSTVLSGLATSNLRRPAVGLNFEISKPDKDPSEVDSLLIDFETLEITPQYLNESHPITVQCKVEVANQTEKSNKIQTSIINGYKKSLESDINKIIVDGINTSNSINGTVTVTVDHPNIKESYSQTFGIASDDLADTVAAENLIAWYPFDNEANDKTAGYSLFGDSTDYSGQVNGATYIDSSTGYEFNGSDSKINCGTVPSQLLGSKSRSFTLWVKHLDTVNQSLFSYGREASSRDGPNFEIYLKGSLDKLHVRGHYVDTYHSYSKVSTDTWHHIAITYSGGAASNTKLYIDGVDQGMEGGYSQSDPWNTDSSDFIIGYGQNYSNKYMNGYIDNFRSYDKELGQSEIDKIITRTQH